MGLSGDLSLATGRCRWGSRIDSVDTKSWRGVIGVEGVARGWDYAAALSLQPDGGAESFDAGDFSVARLRAAMATGLINPFGPSGPEGDALLAATQVTGDMHTRRAHGRVRGEGIKAVFGAAGRPLAIALGAEARRERLRQRLFAVRYVRATSRTSPTCKRRRQPAVQALFAEASIPIVRGPRSAGRGALRPLQRFREHGQSEDRVAMAAGADRCCCELRGVPAFARRRSTTSTRRSQHFLTLPRSRSGALSRYASSPIATAKSSSRRSSAAIRHLQPETSEQFNAGIVWEPVTGLSLTRRLLEDQQERRHRRISATTRSSPISRISSRRTSSADRRIRPFPDLPGPIQTVDPDEPEPRSACALPASTSTCAGAVPTTPFGRFELRARRHLHQRTGRSQPATAFELRRRPLRLVGSVPALAALRSARLDVTAHGARRSRRRIQTGYRGRERRSRRTYRGRRAACRRLRRLGPSGAATRFQRTSTLAFGVKNLLDRAPPFTNLQRGPVGYDPAYADPRGRMFYARSPTRSNERHDPVRNASSPRAGAHSRATRAALVRRPRLDGLHRRDRALSDAHGIRQDHRHRQPLRAMAGGSISRVVVSRNCIVASDPACRRLGVQSLSPARHAQYAASAAVAIASRLRGAFSHADLRAASSISMPTGRPGPRRCLWSTITSRSGFATGARRCSSPARGSTCAPSRAHRARSCSERSTRRGWTSRPPRRACRCSQAQIEPHFLFNTLANVKRLYQTDRATRRAHAATTSWRTSPSRCRRCARRDSTLGRELDHARAYLDIQQIRMGRRLAFGIDVARAAARRTHAAADAAHAGRERDQARTHAAAATAAASTSAQRSKAAACASTSPIPGRASRSRRAAAPASPTSARGSTAQFGADGEPALALNAPRGVVATIVLPYAATRRESARMTARSPRPRRPQRVSLLSRCRAARHRAGGRFAAPCCSGLGVWRCDFAASDQLRSVDRLRRTMPACTCSVR